MKIDTKHALLAALSSVPATPELANLLLEATSRYGDVDDENFYLHRDFLRLNWSAASGVLLDAQNKWVPTPFGVQDHFTHFAVDGSGKVSYTKDEDKGEDDVQTRTTVEKYRANYDVVGSNPDVYITGTGNANPDAAPRDEAPSDTKPSGRAVGIPPAVLAALGAMMEDQDDGAATSADIVRAVNTALDILKLMVKNG